MYFKPCRYVKSEAPYPSRVSFPLPKVPPIKISYSGVFRIFSSGLVAAGVILLFSQIIAPFINFQNSWQPLKPVIGEVSGVKYQVSDFGRLLNHQTSHLSPQASSLKLQVPPPTFFLSIPKLEIKNATVETNSTNLSPDKALAHYQGSALPGMSGNTFIYGHSVLPSFFNPQDYKTIFSTLPNLEKGDEIFIDYAGKTLRYIVEEKKILDPKAVNPLLTSSLKPQASSLILATCVPPGLKNKRLLVQAKLTYHPSVWPQ